MKLLIAAVVSSISLFGTNAFAGPVSQRPAVDASDTPATVSDNAALLRQNNITSTGATVPHPGASQGAGSTPLDRDIERMNNRIESSICKGC